MAPSRGVALRAKVVPGSALLLLVLSSVVAVVLVTTTARAQDVGDELAADGYVVEDGADDVDESQLQAAIAEARDAGVDVSVAFLGDDPSEGAEATADSLAERVGGAALVVTPSEIGASSPTHSSEQLDSALDAAAGELDADPVDAVVAFADELGAGDAAGGFDTSQLPGPLAGMSVTTLIVGAVVLLLVFSVVSRLLGGGRRRRTHHGGHGRGYGGGYGRRRRGGFGRGLAGGLIGGAVGSRMGRGSGGRGGGSGGSRSRSRSSAGRSRSSGSRSRSRSSGSRRR